MRESVADLLLSLYTADRTVIGTRVVGGDYTGPGGPQRIVDGRLITGIEPAVRDVGVIRRGGLVSTGVVDNTRLAGGVVPRLDAHGAGKYSEDGGIARDSAIRKSWFIHLIKVKIQN